MKIYEYKLLTANDEILLENRVNSLLKEGWKPKGSHQVCVYKENGFSLEKPKYSQSLIRVSHSNEE